MFTMQEYVERHKLGVDIHDPHATKILNQHLTDLGYVKVRRKGKWVWVDANDTTDYDALKEKLAKLAKGKK